jgi:sterol desaturase/sphingolipid hydroxylase (fatty acid hydroxylase superfamily)
MTKAFWPNLLVLVSFWVLTYLSYRSDQGLFRDRKFREWALDLSGLFVQGVLIPLIQVFVIFKALQWGAPQLSGSINLAAPLAFLLNFVLVDYLYYWNHRCLHRPSFWPTHAVHHSIGKLDPIASSRNTIWSPLLILYLWVNGAAFFFLKDPFWFLVGASLTAALDLWRHSYALAGSPKTHVGEVLSTVFITPQDHSWHHSASHADFNFGANFNIWDRLHGTFSRRREVPSQIGIKTGLPLSEEFWGLAPKTVFQKIKGRSNMSFLGRSLAFFPLLVMLLTLATAVLSVLQLSIGFAAVSLFTLYLFPPLIFRLHNLVFPLTTGLSRLSGGKYSSWWGGHQIQLIYIAMPSLEGVLRVIPGVYSAWLRLWGSQIGSRVYWTPQVEITDRSLLKIGSGVVIGHKCAFYSHVVNPRKDKISLFVETITVEDGVFVGAGSRAGPGSIIESGVVLPVLTDIRVGQRITKEMVINPDEKINSMKSPLPSKVEVPAKPLEVEWEGEISEITPVPFEGVPAVSSVERPSDFPLDHGQSPKGRPYFKFNVPR